MFSRIEDEIKSTTLQIEKLVSEEVNLAIEYSRLDEAVNKQAAMITQFSQHQGVRSAAGVIVENNLNNPDSLPTQEMNYLKILLQDALFNRSQCWDKICHVRDDLDELKFKMKMLKEKK
ncbi:MAG: hypothetical protein P4M14_02355 [Gammaproteobacteria bacterium]|nr:hypothetical protein [Gammaproteobacteria bacterium]